MNEALKRGLSMPHLTNEELVRRRRGEAATSQSRPPSDASPATETPRASAPTFVAMRSWQPSTGSTRSGGRALCARTGGDFVRGERAPSPDQAQAPIDAKRAQKVSWGDPVMRAKLANAYARAGGDDEKAARILWVSHGSARLRRHLVGATTNHREKAS
jgi:hypothetical protein